MFPVTGALSLELGLEDQWLERTAAPLVEAKREHGRVHLCNRKRDHSTMRQRHGLPEDQLLSVDKCSPRGRVGDGYRPSLGISEHAKVVARHTLPLGVQGLTTHPLVRLRQCKGGLLQLAILRSNDLEGAPDVAERGHRALPGGASLSERPVMRRVSATLQAVKKLRSSDTKSGHCGHSSVRQALHILILPQVSALYALSAAPAWRLDGDCVAGSTLAHACGPPARVGRRRPA